MGKYVCANSCISKDSRGFALAEIVVALFFVTMAVALVGGLAQQVANFSKSSKQTAAVIEMRNRVSSINRDVVDWMDAMRSSSDVGFSVSSCLPDSGMASITFSCPAHDANIFVDDPELQRLAGPQFATVFSTAIVDKRGEKIAGDNVNPLYLDSEGSACTLANPATSCPLKAVGYFLRTNPATNAHPGDVKFYVKIERNNASPASRGLASMKAQYTGVEVGTEWLASTKKCVGGLKLGYLTSGDAYCVSTMSSCPIGQVAVGTKADGSPSCAAPPSCDAGKSPVLSQSSGSFECTDSTSCPAGSVFLGYFGGNGEKICSSPNVKCPNPGQVQVGINDTGGTLSAVCESLPTNCNKSIAFNGQDFICAADTSDIACGPGQVIVGITKEGTPRCEDKIAGKDGVDGKDGVGGTIPVSGLDCGAGNYLQGISVEGKPICKSLVSTSDSVGEGAGSLGQFELPSFATGANSAEKQKTFWPNTCSVAITKKVYPCTYMLWGGLLEADFQDGADKVKSPVSLIPKRADGRNSYLNSQWYTHRTCMYLNGQWRMFTGRNSTNTKNIYGRICTGGVTYESLASPMSLAGEYYGHPPDEASVLVNQVTLASPAFIGRPTAKQFLEFLSECPATTEGVDEMVALTFEEKDHCKNYINAKASAERTMAQLSIKNQIPLYCRYVSASGKSGLNDVRAGGGVKFRYDFRLSSVNKVLSYIIRYRWAINYSFSDGNVLPSGNDCNGGGSVYPNVEAILAVPPPPRSSDFDDVE